MSRGVDSYVRPRSDSCMTPEDDAWGYRDVISNCAVVSDMNFVHDEASGSDLRDALGSALNRGEFSNHAVTSDFYAPVDSPTRLNPLMPV